MSARLTSEELHILQHSLGLDCFGQGQIYRNSFVTDPESTDGQKIRRLIQRGFMVDRGARTLTGGMHLYTVTAAGVDAVALQSPVPPKLTAGQQRYRRYLRSECFETFRDFLAWESRERNQRVQRTLAAWIGAALLALGLSSCQSLDCGREPHFVVPRTGAASPGSEALPTDAVRGPGLTAAERAAEAVMIAEQGLDGLEHMAGRIESLPWPAAVQRRMADWADELRAYVEETRADLEKLKREEDA